MKLLRTTHRDNWSRPLFVTYAPDTRHVPRSVSIISQEGRMPCEAKQFFFIGRMFPLFFEFSCSHWFSKLIPNLPLTGVFSIAHRRV